MTNVSDAPSRLNGERRFYCTMAIVMIALVLIGFAPSFYFQGLVTYPRPNPTLTPLIVLHGLVFSAWMVLFAVQAGLVAADRRDLHRTLGVAGFLLAVALIPIMYLTSVGQVARANQPPFTDPLNWTAVPLFPMPVFIALVYLGWKKRFDAPAHKRLMLGASLLMMDPAIGRFPIVPPTVDGFAIVNLLSLLMFAPLALHDKKQLGDIHWATKLGTGLFLLSLVLRQIALRTGAWAPVAALLPGVN